MGVLKSEQNRFEFQDKYYSHKETQLIYISILIVCFQEYNLVILFNAYGIFPARFSLADPNGLGLGHPLQDHRKDPEMGHPLLTDKSNSTIMQI